jgi:hypothetical protein
VGLSKPPISSTDRIVFEKSNPVVLLLLELKRIEFPAELFESLGYDGTAVTQKTHNRVAIASRFLFRNGTYFPY